MEEPQISSLSSSLLQYCLSMLRNVIFLIFSLFQHLIVMLRKVTLLSREPVRLFCAASASYNQAQHALNHFIKHLGFCSTTPALHLYSLSLSSVAFVIIIPLEQIFISLFFFSVSLLASHNVQYYFVVMKASKFFL